MQRATGKAREIAERLSFDVVGQHRAIAQVAEHIAKWQNEPAPRFPLRLLFTGPTSVGKQLLASSIADTFFSSRFVIHSWLEIPGPLHLNRQLRTLDPGPFVLFFKLFDHGEHELAVVETLLATGGIILGNGQSMSLPDSIIILSASHNFSAELADAACNAPHEWTSRLAARFPWIANALDAAVQLDSLAPDDLADIVARTATVLSKRAGLPIAVTDAAARAIAANQGARQIDDALACKAARVLQHSEVRETLRYEGRTLLIDHADGQFRWLSAPAGAPVPARAVAVSKSPAPGAEIPDVPHFKSPPRPGEFPALNWREEWKFDAFISYKIRKHLAAARELRNHLTRLHYNVWLDEDQIGAADDPWHTKTKEQLIDHLAHGVGRSRCTVVFEAQLEAVALPQGWSKADAEIRGNVMRSWEGTLIAWNWQKLEIDSSSRIIVIREGRPHVSVIDEIRDITSSLLGDGDITPDRLSAAIATAIDHFKKS